MHARRPEGFGIDLLFRFPFRASLYVNESFVFLVL